MTVHTNRCTVCGVEILPAGATIGVSVPGAVRIGGKPVSWVDCARCYLEANRPDRLPTASSRSA